MYEAVVVVGNDAAKKTAFFFWSAVSNESAAEFKKTIIPIARAGSRARVRVILSQILDPRMHDINGPGVALVCTDQYRTYTKNVVRYLTNFSKFDVVKKNTQTELYENEAIASLINDKHISRLECQTATAMARQVLLYGKTKQYLEVFKQPVPIYVIDQKPYAPDELAVKRLLR